MSDIKFAAGGRHILARDYMTLKLWDLNMESKPVAVYSIHENLRSQVHPPSAPEQHCIRHRLVTATTAHIGNRGTPQTQLLANASQYCIHHYQMMQREKSCPSAIESCWK